MRRRLLTLAVISVAASSLPLRASVRAAAPVVTLSATGAKILVASAPLSEAIDALARAAGFKVTYEGPRPSAMLFNAEIETPSVAQTLFRLIEGQNLNYAVMFDLSGKKVTSLMVLGTQSKPGATPTAPAGPSRPQPFTPPRTSRGDMNVVDDDPVETEPEPTPQPTPAPAPAPATPQRTPPGPYPPSPFAPRALYANPFGTTPTPAPSPVASPAPSPPPSPSP